MFVLRVVWSPAARMVLEGTIQVPMGCTVRQALQQLCTGPMPWPTGPCLDTSRLAECGTSLWGRKAGYELVLREGDRLELSRSLRVDPKLARQQRFRQQGSKRAGLFAKRRPGAAAGY